MKLWSIIVFVADENGSIYLSRRGGIGRHARLRILSILLGCGFKSRRLHLKKAL